MTAHDHRPRGQRMTEDRLLAAVDALTKPHVVARYTGTDHTHEWLPLVRETSREERHAAKRKRQKLARTVETGEWWCMWCDTVASTKPDEAETETIDRRDEDPLLDQLAARIGTTLGDSGTRGARTGGSPIDVDAYDEYAKIDATIRGWYRDLGATPGRGLSLVQLLRSWYVLYRAGHAPVGDDDAKARIIETWRTKILDILDPPDQIPYRGQPCPVCGETRARNEQGGVEQDTVALWAFLRPAYREEGSYGLCKACKTVLARNRDPLALRSRMNGVAATRLTRTIGEAISE